MTSCRKKKPDGNLGKVPEDAIPRFSGWQSGRNGTRSALTRVLAARERPR